MDQTLIEDVLGHPDAADIVRELRQRLEAREYEQMSIATRLAETEKDVARVVRILSKAERMYPDDPLKAKLGHYRAYARLLLADVRARLKAERS